MNLVESPILHLGQYKGDRLKALVKSAMRAEIDFNLWNIANCSRQEIAAIHRNIRRCTQ